MDNAELYASPRLPEERLSQDDAWDMYMSKILVELKFKLQIEYITYHHSILVGPRKFRTFS